jgi:simple sugar transport system ATP-binding protein
MEEPVPPELELRRIVKRFPGVLANDHVDLAIEKGEIRALVGENGAGKSTLMRILYGLYQPDSGDILLRGRKVIFHSPQEAIRAGLGMVHQHFMLFPSLTVLENIIYGAEPSRFGFINRATARQQVAELMEHYGLAVHPDATIGQLSVGMRQRVEIIKTLYRQADILILDEPTSVLTPREEEEFFHVLRRLADNGKTIIFITHKLDEVMRITDQATVLRDGAVITTVRTAESSPAELSHAMVGRDVLLRPGKPLSTTGNVVLDLEDVSVRDNRGQLAADHISLSVREGEIVGIAGVAGNGQAELVEALVGLRPVASGRMTLRGREATHATVAERRQAGLAYIPEDRGHVGLALDAPLGDNLLMGYQRRPGYGRRGLLNFGATRRHAQQLIRQYGIKTAGYRETTANLSGGNRQKGVIAREVAHRAPILIAEQPTWGVDVGSIEFIHRQLLEYRQQGNAILLISADLNEVMSLSDRILVMYEGRIAGEVPGAEATEYGLGLLMTGATSAVRHG